MLSHASLGRISGYRMAPADFQHRTQLVRVLSNLMRFYIFANEKRIMGKYVYPSPVRLTACPHVLLISIGPI